MGLRTPGKPDLSDTLLSRDLFFPSPQVTHRKSPPRRPEPQYRESPSQKSACFQTPVKRIDSSFKSSARQTLRRSASAFSPQLIRSTPGRNSEDTVIFDASIISPAFGRSENKRKSILRHQVEARPEKKCDSPPPPPPPLFDRDSEAPQKKKSLSVDYVQRITKTAGEYRSSVRDKQGDILLTKVKNLERELSTCKQNERNLHSINSRLQERLVLFHTQNSKNVQVAKDKIQDLETKLRDALVIKHLNSSKEIGIASGRVSATEKFLESHNWKGFKNIHRFQMVRENKRERELKVRVLRSWACSVLLLKICNRSRNMKIHEIAHRCLIVWNSYAKRQRRIAKHLHLLRNRSDRREHLRKMFTRWRISLFGHKVVLDAKWFVDSHIKLQKTFLIWKTIVVDLKHLRKFLLCKTLSDWKQFCLDRMRSRLKIFHKKIESRFLDEEPYNGF